MDKDLSNRFSKILHNGQLSREEKIKKINILTDKEINNLPNINKISIKGPFESILYGINLFKHAAISGYSAFFLLCSLVILINIGILNSDKGDYFVTTSPLATLIMLMCFLVLIKSLIRKEINILMWLLIPQIITLIIYILSPSKFLSIISGGIFILTSVIQFLIALIRQRRRQTDNLI